MWGIELVDERRHQSIHRFVNVLECLEGEWGGGVAVQRMGGVDTMPERFRSGVRLAGYYDGKVPVVESLTEQPTRNARTSVQPFDEREPHRLGPIDGRPRDSVDPVGGRVVRKVLEQIVRMRRCLYTGVVGAPCDDAINSWGSFEVCVRSVENDATGVEPRKKGSNRAPSCHTS